MTTKGQSAIVCWARQLRGHWQKWRHDIGGVRLERRMDQVVDLVSQMAEVVGMTGDN